MSSAPVSILFCIPIYNDWTTAGLLLKQLDEALKDTGWTVRVTLVDDGSTEPSSRLVLPAAFESIDQLEVLALRRNVGHQRAIGLGLTYLYAERPPASVVVVMDGDGEDAAADAVKLVRETLAGDANAVVFAQRSRRSEDLTFRIGYRLFKLVHRVLTGRGVEVGNFSAVPPAALARLVAVSELWNHYAAAVYKARIPIRMVPIPRADRLAGSSTMNVTALVVHGLSALSIFGDQIGVRLLLGNVLMMALVAIGLIIVGFIRFFTTAMAIPGWFTMAGGLLMTLLLVNILLSMVFVFIILQGRSGTSFLPLRDYAYYIIGATRLYGDEHPATRDARPPVGIAETDEVRPEPPKR